MVELPRTEDSIYKVPWDESSSSRLDRLCLPCSLMKLKSLFILYMKKLDGNLRILSFLDSIGYLNDKEKDDVLITMGTCCICSVP